MGPTTHKSSGVKDVAHVFRKVLTNCGHRYQDNDTGRLSGPYAGSTLHYIEMITKVRWEDMEIDYLNKHNKFAFMGIGRHMAQTDEGRAAGLSSSPYYRPERIDSRILDLAKKAKI
ncbi:putative sterigmatocystin biosynthesis monooxygenase [Lachnellula occidentalis]|uniref:Putative sterigmatocystin biosynthesis monooxygenase n=1 Tax=Lachnellula occidentalis TaxID=215460 RepID=A0A8H8RG76_9HELO|nr:putative sterigmatocystin biosynthesis monooxygenase [Lachnellula occidentalis]